MLELERLAQQVVDQWETRHLAEAVRALAGELEDVRKHRQQCQRYIALARTRHVAPSDGDLEIDDEPLVSDSEDGQWVGAWILVRHDDVQECEHD